MGNDRRRHGNNQPPYQRTCNHEQPHRPGQAVQNHQTALWANGLAFFRGSRAYGRRPRRFGILHLFFHGRLWRSHARTDSRRNEIAIRTAAFLTLSLGEQERRYFYALMLRSRGKKSLDLSGLQNAKQRKQGKDTLPLKIRVLLRNKSKAKE